MFSKKTDFINVIFSNRLKNLKSYSFCEVALICLRQEGVDILDVSVTSDEVLESESDE